MKKKLEQKELINTAWMAVETLCWVQIGNEDSDSFPDLFAPAQIVEVQDQKVVVSYSRHEGLPNPVDVGQVYPMNVYEDDGFTDMVVMEALNEAEILQNLRVRYNKDIIFTYIGPTLMVMNPYKSMESQLGPQILSVYQKQTQSVDAFNLRETPPHTYAVAAYSYRKLFENTRNQAIVISGESGAGKTENAKIAMRFLTSLSETDPESVKIDKSERIEEKIMACNPILESFGNAKTVRNDNSSRFGKYVRIIVNSESRRIKGAAINNYLLEKSRVVGPGPLERNYHVFYSVLKGCTQVQLEQLKLTHESGEAMIATDFEFLNLGQCTEVQTVNDKKWFQELMESFEYIQFTKDEQSTVLQCLASIMLLGNLKFDASTLTDKNPCDIATKDIFLKISSLLAIAPEEMQKTLTIKTREVGKTLIESPLNESDAYSNRNALASNLYDRLFSWLVKRLNTTIIPKEDLKNATNVRSSIKSIRRQSTLGIKLQIGLLDIFGFENFKHNSFEQYCINYTNEKLQQLYISYVFKSEEQEFVNEGLKDFLSQLNYSDNSTVIELMDKPPQGIFDLIDEVTQLGSGTDDALYQKIIKIHKDNKHMVVPKTAKDTFSIVHTAKNVEYNIVGFRSKNKSEISSDLVKGIMSSSNELLQQIFLVLCGNEIANKAEELEKIKKPTKTDKYLGAKFRQQMKQLMDELSTSDCHFIRCLKPNEIKKPDHVIASYCLLQIKYLGVLESIKVRKDGFPYRKDYKVFYQQYHEIYPKYRHTSIYKQKEDLRVICPEIVKLIDPSAYILPGDTKFFAKDKVGRIIDLALTDWVKHKQSQATKLQKAYKRHLFRKQLNTNLHKLVLIIRKFYRIMAHFRRRRQRKIFLDKKKSIQMSNKIFWRFQVKKALTVYSIRVKQIIKHANQKEALQLVIGILYKVMTRRGLLKYQHQVVRKQKTIAIQQFIIFKTTKLSKHFKHLDVQCKIRAAQLLELKRLREEQEEKERLHQLELKRLREEQEEKERLHQIELKRLKEEQEEEAQRLLELQRLQDLEKEKQRQLEEQRKKREQEEILRVEEERRVNQIKEDQIREEERQALIKSGQQEEANRLQEQYLLADKKRQEEALLHQKQQNELKALKEIEISKELEQLERDQKSNEVKQKELQVQQTQKSENQEPIDIIPKPDPILQTQQNSHSIASVDSKPLDSGNPKQSALIIREPPTSDNSQPSASIIPEPPTSGNPQPPYIREQVIAKIQVEKSQEIIKDSNAQEVASVEKTTNLKGISTNLDKVQTQDSIGAPLETNNNKRHSRKKSSQDKNELISEESKHQSIKRPSQLSQSSCHENQEHDDSSSNEPTSPKDQIPSYLNQDFFQSDSDAAPNVQQSALRRNQEEDDEKAQSRKRITVSNNVLPFIPKDYSDLQGFLVVRSQYKQVQPQFQDIPISGDFSLKFDKIDQAFMKKVSTSHFLDYCSAVVRKRKKMFSDVPVDKIMCWQNVPLDKSLTHLPVTLESKVKTCTSLVYQFCGEVKSSSKDDSLQIYLNLIGHIFDTAALIDEIYLLVLKQIIKNSSSTQLKYCQLLVVLASCVAPTPKSLFPIMNCIEIGSRAFEQRENINTATIPLLIGVQGQEASELLKLAFLRLMKTFSRARKYPPSETELQLTLSYKQLVVPVFMYQGNVDYLLIEPHFTERQLLEVMIKKNHMYPNWENLGICKCNGYCETFLEENALIVDVMREIEEISKEIKQSGSLVPYPYLALRIKVFFVFQPYDLDSLCLYYMHFSNEYMKGNYSITQELTCQLACMKMISEHGCLKKNKGQVPRFSASQYVPVQKLDDDDLDWVALLSEKYKHYPHLDEMEARARFLEDIRRFPVFMTWQYPCNYYTNKDDQGTAIILAIRPFQLYICDFEKREIKQRYHFLQVILWGQQKEIITIETEDGVEHKFKMYRGKDDAIGFNSIMKTYMDRALLQQVGV